MSWDVLLHWMTHIQEGAWSTFRGAVAKLAGEAADVDAITRGLRIFLSDLGHADFFIEGSQRWRIRPPTLAGLTPPAGSAIVTGERSPKLIADLAEGAANHRCRVVTDSHQDRPASIRVEGDPAALAAVAAVAGIPFIGSFASVLCGAIAPIPRLVEAASIEEAPANWSVRSFAFDSLLWVDGLRDRSACEFRSRYGPTRYYLHTRRKKLLRLPKREAVYGAAMLRGLTVAHYDPATSVLSVSPHAPLPEAYARAACLCAGAPSVFEHGRLSYQRVAPDVAAVLLVAAGQPYPDRHTPLRETEQRHGQPV